MSILSGSNFFALVNTFDANIAIIDNFMLFAKNFWLINYVSAYRLLSEQVLSHWHICKFALSETSPIYKFVPCHWKYSNFFKNLVNVSNIWFSTVNIPINKIALKYLYLPPVNEIAER